ncbi:MAG: ABC transporter permease [Zoogloea sp.]|uniref:ABC transporter permease n=1 Tax=Zoogloea sp. TaxID=49181 RepID=UPI002621BD53|nr:ABC transporter permease [Zoogloea sp.]MDD2987864.1 ABC transporter permease [Zoogloea sp.]
MARFYPISPLTAIHALICNRHMVIQLTKREVEGRYKGSIFGFAWALLNPLILLALYTFVFGYVFRARWGAGSNVYDSAEYAVILYAGLILHGFFAECLARAPGLIVGNPNFVKKIVFPLELLAWAHHGAAWFHFFMSWTVLVFFQLIVFGHVPLTVFLLPMVVLPCVLYAQGLMWGVSALTVYFRDLAQLIGLVVTCLLFASPVLYPLDSVPESFRGFLYLNPLTSSLEMFRSVMIWGRVPDVFELFCQILAGLGVFCGGLFIFQRSRSGFADVL